MRCDDLVHTSCAGRIVVESFPAIFGPHENEPLDTTATTAAFTTLADTINTFYGAWRCVDGRLCATQTTPTCPM